MYFYVEYQNIQLSSYSDPQSNEELKPRVLIFLTKA